MDEELVMRLLRESGMERKAIHAITFTSWKDGIDIERPTTALMRFVAAVQAVTPAITAGDRK